MPGVNPDPDGYGDWRDMTIAEGLHWLRLRWVSLLLALGLIEDLGDQDDEGVANDR
jgi:hypothetical protein